MARIRLMDGERVVGDTEELEISAGDIPKNLEKERDIGYNTGTIVSGLAVIVAGLACMAFDYFKYKKNR